MAATRREFLIGTGAALLSFELGARLASAARSPPRSRTPAAPLVGDLIIGAMQTMSLSTKRREFALVALALDGAGGKWRIVALPFHLHGFSGHPRQPGVAALFEKKGPGACVVDLVGGKITQPITAAAGRAFYGHGAWSADGGLLYCTETVLATQQGLIVVRDGKSLREVGSFPSHGEEPHDCHLTRGGKVMVITNGGGNQDPGADRPSVTYVEVPSGKLLEKVTLSTPRLNTGHLALSARGDLAVVSAPRKGLPHTDPGGISLRYAGEPRGSKLVTPSEPKDVVAKMTGETLSVAIHEPSLTVAATNPDGNLLTFWSLREARLLTSVTLDHPRGVLVTPDGKHFAVTHGSAPPELSYFSTKTLTTGERPGIPDANLSGSHIYRWRV